MAAAPSLTTLLHRLDALSLGLGRLLRWGVLGAVLLSAGNALLRKTLDLGSNAALEAPWYVFAAVVLLGAGPVLQRNGHVRIDVLAQRFGPRWAAGIDLVALLAVLLPFCLLMIELSWPLFLQAWRSGEMSQNAGGLPRWPAWALLPAGFGLLALQALAEALRRGLYLRGRLASPFAPPPAQPSPPPPTGRPAGAEAAR